MVKHGFDRYFLFSIPPEICTFKGLSAVATDKRCEHCLCSQSKRVTGTLHPDIQFFGEIRKRYGTSTDLCLKREKRVGTKQRGVRGAPRILFLLAVHS